MIRLRKGIPLILQGESKECGLACVAMLLGHHGHHLSLRELRQRIPHGKQVTLQEMSSLLQEHGLLPRCLRGEPKDLRNLQLPAIMHVDFEHYLIVESTGRGGIRVIDPATGKCDLSWETVNRRFTGIVIEAVPGPKFQKTGKESRYSVWSLLRRLPTAGLASSLAGLILLTLLIQAFALITPLFLQIMVDEVLMVNNLEMTSMVVSCFALIYLVSALTQGLRGLVSLSIGTRLSYLLSTSLMSHVSKISLPYFHRRTLGDIASRFSSMQPIRAFLTEGIVGMLIDCIMILTTFIVLACFSVVIAMTIMLMAAAYMLLQYLLLLPFRRHQHEYLIRDAELQTHFIESVQTVETTRRYSATRQRLQDWQNRLIHSLNAQFRARRWLLGADMLRYLFGGILSIAVVGLATGDVVSGIISIGMLYTLTAYAGHLTSALMSLSSQWQSYLMLSLHTQRLSDLTEASCDERIPLQLNVPFKNLEIRSVTCRHHEDSVPVLKGFSMKIRAGESIAVTGPSGSGKSTLLAMIRGDLTPDKGSILINGQPLQPNQNPERLFSCMQESDRIIRGSVIDNITYLDPQADQERLVQAAGLSGCHRQVMGWPLSYQEKLSEENLQLSSGQRQRLLLARALYRNAEILLLDEATSHLDTSSEMEVMKKILALKRTCIFVTHRKNVAALADRTIAFQPDKGK